MKKVLLRRTFNTKKVLLRRTFNTKKVLLRRTFNANVYIGGRLEDLSSHTTVLTGRKSTQEQEARARRAFSLRLPEIYIFLAGFINSTMPDSCCIVNCGNRRIGELKYMSFYGTRP